MITWVRLFGQRKERYENEPGGNGTQNTTGEKTNRVSGQ